MEPSNDDIFDEHIPAWETQAEIDEDGATFLVLREGSAGGNKPVLVWVHPGDACESDSPDPDTRLRARELEGRMGQAILDRLDTHRVIVLHRQSSVFAFASETNRVHPLYALAMARCLDNTDATLLWGDDLDQAGAWLCANRGAATEAFLTGAWRHIQWGCVTAVGMALMAGGMHVAVCEHCPSEPGTVIHGWEGSLASGRRERFQP